MRHTAGPWRIGGEEHGWAQNCAIIGPGGVIIVETIHASAEEEAANLHLVAAAPDLISAAIFAEDILGAFLDDGYSKHELLKARAALQEAIKKAEPEGKHDATR